MVLWNIELLGDGIYDCLAMQRRYPTREPVTHAVAFVDYGKCEGRPYLKFLNTHGVYWGKDGFGKVYFDGINQPDDNFCFHTLSFEDAAPSSLPTTSAPIANQSKPLPPCTAHLPCRQFKTGSTACYLISSFTPFYHNAFHNIALGEGLSLIPGVNICRPDSL
jgi:hypothetical protein